jgi:hypothetical protein
LVRFFIPFSFSVFGLHGLQLLSSVDQLLLVLLLVVVFEVFEFIYILELPPYVLSNMDSTCLNAASPTSRNAIDFSQMTFYVSF